jgi:glycosyltransferase involved in cell wall biosynthesis
MAVLRALVGNFLAKDVVLHIFADGPRSVKDVEGVLLVREICHTFDGFKSITVHESDANKGLANSVRAGIDFVLSLYTYVIVLEDDIETSCNFLDFMVGALDFYAGDKSVLTISGYSPILSDTIPAGDIYKSPRMSTWGWGIWRDRWCKIKWDLDDARGDLLQFSSYWKMSKMGSDFRSLLKAQLANRIDSWAIYVAFYQWKTGSASVVASQSKCKNIGFGSAATHTKDGSRFLSELDVSNRRVFSFEHRLDFSPEILSEAMKPFSIKSRVMSKLRMLYNTLFRGGATRCPR